MNLQLSQSTFKTFSTGKRTGNLFDEITKRCIVSRIITLSHEQEPRWGKMNVQEMLAHCALALESALIYKGAETNTLPCYEMDYISKLWYCTSMTQKINETEAKMKRLIYFIKHFVPENISQDAQPFLGDMIYKELGEIHFLHLDHHLNQFGI